MNPTNLISAYQGAIAFQNKTVYISRKLDVGLKAAEAKTLAKLYEILKSYDDSFKILDGYYIGYTIKQISKEFDLLRFSNETIIDIELKAPLDEQIKVQKITEQMRQNYYYLKFLGKDVLIYTYVEDDALYKYDSANCICVKTDFNELIDALKSQAVNSAMNPDKLFIPSNYLISPFNHTDKFMNNEYFLTGSQQEIKKQIINTIKNNLYECFCVSANAGTGKTLMLYDIAKTIINDFGNRSVMTIHCGKLNDGHVKLKDDYKWNIITIADINQNSADRLITEGLKLILIDEAQRIRTWQLDIIIKKSIEHNIPIVFTYDKKQFLSSGETLDLHDYITENFNEIIAHKKELTNKIRTNREMASFITNLMNIGKSNAFLDYEAISIEYFDSIEDVKKYIEYLENQKGWKAVKYTTSQYRPNALDSLLPICSSNAHDVIGQEFEKVVFVMDKNFSYDESGTLIAYGSYYSAIGMLYQIVTRVVNELKIIVLDNPDLYCRLLEIKAMDKGD
ncbi:MAG: DUF2075 domain-containing protein [Clostridia bacterium]|nr:DUF2075 domain-containing protein [Clostridia bacterium]